jgi:hypothetical protein
VAKVIKGEQLAKIRFRIFSRDDNGTKAPVDLTGTTLVAKYSIAGGIQKSYPLTIVTAADGTCEFTPDASAFDVTGQAIGRIEITSSGKTGKTFRFFIDVEDDY